MKLDEEFSLHGEAYNWTLKYAKPTGEVTDTGKPVVSRDKWYFPKLSQALSRYLNEAVKPAQSVRDLYNKVTEIEDTIEKLVINKDKVKE